jgi:hypothetical protein
MQSQTDYELYVNEAAERLGLTVRQFRQKQTDRWRGLLNRRLHYRAEPGHHGGYPRHRFRASEIDHLAALLRQQTGLAPGWIDEQTYRDATGDWLTDTGAREQFGLPVRSLRRWRRQRCRFNEGKVLTHRRVPAPCPERSRRGRGKVQVYLASELAHVAQVYHSDFSQPAYHDVDGTVCLTLAQIAERYEVRPKLVHYWAAKPSRLHAGKALRWIEVIRAKRGKSPGRALIRAYRQDDLERILRDEETVYVGTGRPSKRIKGNRQSEMATDKTEPPVRKGRGRRVSPQTIELGRFCYEYLGKYKRRKIAALVLERFGRVLSQAEVTIYAKRYAIAKHESWPVLMV